MASTKAGGGRKASAKTAKTTTQPKTASKPKAAPKKAAASKAKAVGHRLVRATAALKKGFEKVRAQVRRLRSTGTDAFDELYELVGDVLDSEPPLYVGGGYQTKEEFIAAELPGETLRSVKRNVLVARCFSAADEARHGIAFLEEVAQYAKELAGAAEAPRAIDLDRLVVMFAGPDGKSVRKKARDASVEEVRKARRAMRKGGQTKKPASPAEAAVRTALHAHKALRQVTVRVTREGVSFGTVPWSALRDLSKVLAQVEVEVPAEDE